MAMTQEVVNLEPVAVRRKTAATMLDCSETTIWKLCKEGKLDVVKVGADDRVTTTSIKRIAAVRVGVSNAAKLR